MKLAVLFSGGKDSCLALHKAQEAGHEIVCLISMISRNEESYMFHVPNIEVTDLQAESMGIPLLKVETKGEKEKELEDLKHALQLAQDEMGIEGVVTGALGSVYQATRVQNICADLDLWCFNPLWQMNQLALVKEVVKKGFKVMIVGVFAYPLEESWLGRILDDQNIEELEKLSEKFDVSPSGEGGELETFVLDAPLFSSPIQIVEHEVEYENHSGVFVIKEASL